MHSPRSVPARRVRRSVAVAAALAAVSLTAAACGSKDATPTTDVPNVTGTNATVQLDSSLLSTFSNLRITPSVSGGVVFNQTTWTLPITGGHFAIYRKADADPPVEGELDSTNSTMTLASGNTTVKLTDLKVELFKDPTIQADIQVGSEDAHDNVALVEFDRATMSPLQHDSSNGTYTLAHGQGYISSDAADILNPAFNTEAIKGGIGTGTKVGTGTITIATK
jgi:hypothetical protein